MPQFEEHVIDSAVSPLAKSTEIGLRSDIDHVAFELAQKLASFAVVDGALTHDVFSRSRDSALEFISGVVSFPPTGLDLENVETVVSVAFALFGKSLDEPKLAKLKQWVWVYLLQDSPILYVKLDKSVLARDLVLWLAGRINQPEFFTQSKIVGHSLVRDPLRRRDFYRSIVNTALVSQGTNDVLQNHVIRDFCSDNQTSWTAIRIFSNEVCEQFGIEEAFSEGAVNYLPVLKSTTKYLKQCLITNVDEFLLVPVEDMTLGQREVLLQVGIDPDYLIEKDPEAVLCAREDWLIERMDALVGGLIVKQPLDALVTQAPEFKLKSRGAVGLAVKTGSSRLLVLPGSVMSADFNGSLRSGDRNIREQILLSGKAVLNEDGTAKFIAPYEFDSRSSAASVLSGRRSAAYKWLEVEPGQTATEILATTTRRWKRRPDAMPSPQIDVHDVEDHKNSVFADLLKRYSDEIEANPPPTSSINALCESVSFVSSRLSDEVAQFSSEADVDGDLFDFDDDEPQVDANLADDDLFDSDW